MVPGQDAHRLRERPARPVPRSRRLDLLVQRGLRRADVRPAGQKAARHEGGAHLPLPAGWHGHRAGDDRRHGQPRRRRVHARRRTHLHHDVLAASRRRTARRIDPRHLRRRVRQGARRARRTSPHRRRDAAAGRTGAGRSLRAGALRIAIFGERLPRQSVRLPVQHAQGLAARADAGRRHVRSQRRGFPRLATTSTFIRPTCSKTPTAACSSSTRAAGTSSAVRRRNCGSPICSGASTACAAPADITLPMHAAGRSIGQRSRPNNWRRCWPIRAAPCATGATASCPARSKRPCRIGRRTCQIEQCVPTRRGGLDAVHDERSPSATGGARRPGRSG